MQGEVPNTCTLTPLPFLHRVYRGIGQPRSEEKLLRRSLSLCGSLCRPERSPEPHGLVSASSLRKVPLVGCQDTRAARRGARQVAQLRIRLFFSCFSFTYMLYTLSFVTFNFLEFQRSLAERERTSCRFPRFQNCFQNGLGPTARPRPVSMCRGACARAARAAS